jgi:antitoxin CptB
MTKQQLYWRCRRGSLELDLLLLNYLENQYANDSMQKKEAFSQLLSLDDCELWTALADFLNPHQMPPS